MRVPFMCNFRDFHQGKVGGGEHLSLFSADSVGPSLARQIKTIRNSDVISDFLSRNEGADKTAGAQAGLGICF